MSIATKDFAYPSGRVPGRAPRTLPSASALGRQARAIPARARREIFRAVLLIVSGLLALTAFGLSARAGGTHVLVIPADDGYGLSDCLTENAACGPMVASAWCKAKGHGASGTFGSIAPQATATDTALAAVQGPRGFAVTCHE